MIISTIHSAKGLEADICFVVNVSPRSFPSSRCLDVDEIEEDRRVLYVALTRAKNELIVTRSQNSIYAEARSIAVPNASNGGTQEQPVIEHYFLNGLPDDIAEQEVIEVFKREIPDLSKPNSLDIAYGMDFS